MSVSGTSSGSIIGYSLVRQLGSHPVFLLSNGKGHVVVKAEMVSQRITNVNEARFSAAFMADIFSKTTEAFASLRLLTSFELPFLSTILGNNEEGKRALSMTVAANNHNRVDCFWYVMAAAVNCFDMDKIVKEKTKPEIGKVCTLIRNGPKLLRDLGKVTAVDLFVANHDRFRAERTTTQGMPKLADLAWQVANMGNIFFLADKDVTWGRFSGIDFYESMNVFNNFFQPFSSQLDQSEYGFWLGEVLKEGNAKLRDAMADQIMTDLGGRLNGVVALGDKHKKEFREGIGDGREAMKKYFKNLKKTRPTFMSFTGIPQGITQRLQLLGWN